MFEGRGCAGAAGRTGSAADRFPCGAEAGRRFAVTGSDMAEIDAHFPVRVLAPNPGPFTLEGTNTWIVGRERTIVIDPGPDDAAHIEEVRRSAGAVAQIVVTHRH